MIPEPHNRCAQVIRQEMADLGIDVAVEAQQPMFSNWARTATCPHHVTYYYQPTREQIITWLENGVS